jgi:hypothetical protein
MTLREDRFNPSTEIRIPLPAGAQLIVDTQRFWHAVWHRGPEPRYCLITSWESGPQLDAYIEKYHGTSVHENPHLSQQVIDEAQATVHRRLAERSAALVTPADPEA